MSSLVLSLETSTPTLSAALLRREGATLELLGTRTAAPPEVVSTRVPGVFQELLDEAGASLDQVSVVVSGLGPGLFTGARVAVSTMKAIAYARGVPLIGAQSLETMAWTVARGGALVPGDRVEPAAPIDSGLLCPVLDARRGEVYYSLLRFRGGVPEVVAPPAACPPAELGERLRDYAEPIVAFGSGTRAAPAAFEPGGTLSVREEPMYPGAAETAVRALALEPDPVFDPARLLALEPVYVRPPEAAVALQRRLAGLRTGG